MYSMNNSAKSIGELGERIAEKYLKKKGYKILDKNFTKRIGSFKFGELDIVAEKEEIVVFFEVKTLQKKGAIFPEEKVNQRKKKRIEKLAEVWLDEHKGTIETRWQIDVLGIVLNPIFRKAKVRHFKNV